jgi:hypothetical protein
VTYALLLSPFTGHLLFFSLPLYYHFSTLLSCNPRLACPCLVSPSIYLTPCFTPSLRPPLHFTLPVFDFSSLISCIYLLHPRFLISCFLAFTCISSLYTPIDKKASVYLLYPQRSSQLLGLLHFVLPLNFNSHSYRQASRVLSYPFHLNLHFNC